MKNLRVSTLIGILFGILLLRVPYSEALEGFILGGNAIDWECNAERCSYCHDLGHNGWSDLDRKWRDH